MFAHASSKISGAILKRQPQPTQRTDRVDQHVVLMEEGCTGEKEEQEVERRQQMEEVVASSPPVPALSSPHAEAAGQEEQRQELSMVENE